MQTDKIRPQNTKKKKNTLLKKIFFFFGTHKHNRNIVEPERRHATQLTKSFNYTQRELSLKGFSETENTINNYYPYKTKQQTLFSL